jgi:hypothetical protein
MDTCVRDIESAGVDETTTAAILAGTAERWFGPDPLRAV